MSLFSQQHLGNQELKLGEVKNKKEILKQRLHKINDGSLTMKEETSQSKVSQKDKIVKGMSKKPSIDLGGKKN